MEGQRADGGPTYSWGDISGTGTEVTLANDAYETVDIGFTFPFMKGHKATQVHIGSNGLLGLGDSGSMDASSHQTIPTSGAPNNMVCPFWDDLDPSLAGTIHYESLGTEPERRFPEVDGNWPLYVTTFDTSSRSAYGTRLLVVRESEAGSTSELNNIARSMLEQRKFDLLQGRFNIENWTLEPGDKVSMYLPTIGVNNGASGVPWVLMEVEEQVNRGVTQRWGTFVEHVDAASIRVR